MSQAAGASERLLELLAVVPDIRSPANPTPLPHPARGEIEFDAVRFRYSETLPDAPSGAAALDGLSFKVEAGEIFSIEEKELTSCEKRGQSPMRMPPAT